MATHEQIKQEISPNPHDYKEIRLKISDCQDIDEQKTSRLIQQLLEKPVQVETVQVEYRKPGYRFVPKDEELILDYLKKKIMNEPLMNDEIQEVNLYQHNPQYFAERYDSFEDDWYFFTPRDRKYLRGSRPNRAAGNGYWKATGADKTINHNDEIIGFRKVLVFYEGKPPKGDKTCWIMHEFRVNQEARARRSSTDMRLDDYVLCRIYKKAKKASRNEQPSPADHPAAVGESSGISQEIAETIGNNETDGDGGMQSDDHTLNHGGGMVISDDQTMNHGGGMVSDDQTMNHGGGMVSDGQTMNHGGGMVVNDMGFEHSSELINMIHGHNMIPTLQNVLPQVPASLMNINPHHNLRFHGHGGGYIHQPLPQPQPPTPPLPPTPTFHPPEGTSGNMHLNQATMNFNAKEEEVWEDIKDFQCLTSTSYISTPDQYRLEENSYRSMGFPPDYIPFPPDDKTFPKRDFPDYPYR